MIRYYAARADEYDDWYLRRGRYSHGRPTTQAGAQTSRWLPTWLDGRGFVARSSSWLRAPAGGRPCWQGIGQTDPLRCLGRASREARTRLAAPASRRSSRYAMPGASLTGQVDGLFAGFCISHVVSRSA